MKKGVLGALAWSIPYFALAQGLITLNSDDATLTPDFLSVVISPETTFRTSDANGAVGLIGSGSVFFPGSSGSGSSYFTGGGSITITPPSSALDVRSRSFVGSDYFNSADQMADSSFALQLGNGVNPLLNSAGRLEVVPEASVAHGNEPFVLQKGMAKADGSFEFTVKGAPHHSFTVEFSTDGKTFSGLMEKALSGVLARIYSCGDDGQCTVVDPEAGQSSSRLYRLRAFDQSNTTAGN